MDPSKRTLARVTLPRAEEVVEARRNTHGPQPELRFKFSRKNAEFRRRRLDVSAARQLGKVASLAVRGHAMVCGRRSGGRWSRRFLAAGVLSAARALPNPSRASPPLAEPAPLAPTAARSPSPRRRPSGPFRRPAASRARWSPYATERRRGLFADGTELAFLSPKRRAEHLHPDAGDGRLRRLTFSDAAEQPLTPGRRTVGGIYSPPAPTKHPPEQIHPSYIAGAPAGGGARRWKSPRESAAVVPTPRSPPAARDARPDGPLWAIPARSMVAERPFSHDEARAC